MMTVLVGLTAKVNKNAHARAWALSLSEDDPDQ
jgi:hypothetical protein